jgi:hypothetical protein
LERLLGASVDPKYGLIFVLVQFNIPQRELCLALSRQPMDIDYPSRGRMVYRPTEEFVEFLQLIVPSHEMFACTGDPLFVVPNRRYRQKKATVSI